MVFQWMHSALAVISALSIGVGTYWFANTPFASFFTPIASSETQPQPIQCNCPKQMDWQWLIILTIGADFLWKAIYRLSKYFIASKLKTIATTPTAQTAQI